MKLLKKYEFVSTTEFQGEWDKIRVDLYKTFRNKEIIYYPRVFSRGRYLLSKCGERTVAHWLWIEESFSLCKFAGKYIRAENDERALDIIEIYLNYCITGEEIPYEIGQCILKEIS